MGKSLSRFEKKKQTKKTKWRSECIPHHPPRKITLICIHFFPPRFPKHILSSNGLVHEYDKVVPRWTFCSRPDLCVHSLNRVATFWFELHAVRRRELMQLHPSSCLCIHSIVLICYCLCSIWTPWLPVCHPTIVLHPESCSQMHYVLAEGAKTWTLILNSTHNTYIRIQEMSLMALMFSTAHFFFFFAQE